MVAQVREAREESDRARNSEHKKSTELQVQLSRNDEQMLKAHQKLNEKMKENCDLETLFTENERSYSRQKKDFEENIEKL